MKCHPGQAQFWRWKGERNLFRDPRNQRGEDAMKCVRAGLLGGPGTNLTYLSSLHLCVSGMTFHSGGVFKTKTP